MEKIEGEIKDTATNIRLLQGGRSSNSNFYERMPKQKHKNNELFIAYL